MNVFWTPLFFLYLPVLGNTYNDVDASTEYMVIPNKGLLFERTGTIFSYPQMNLLTVVVSLDNIDIEKLAVEQNQTRCLSYFRATSLKFKNRVNHYRKITEAIFQAKNIFTTDEICNIFENVENFDNVCPQKRSKRFVAAAGAYVLAGASLAVATAAAGLAAANKAEINRINSYISEHEDSIASLQESLRLREETLDFVINTQETLLGYVKQMATKMDDLKEVFSCMHKDYIYYQWTVDTINEIENLLQFIFLGQTYGRLTPKLIRPDLLKQFIEKQSPVNSNILGKYPNMLYQTAVASMMKADFENLQFTYLVTYPNFQNDPIYPFFTVRQNGFWADFENTNVSECFMFNMPDTAIIHKNTMYLLQNTINCPNFGNVRICDNSQFDMIQLDNCISLEERSKNITDLRKGSYCNLRKCFGGLMKNDSYISSSPGLLLRTTVDTLDIVYDVPQFQLHKASIKSTIKTPPSGSTFITWQQNVSAVAFSNTVVYSPQDADHHLQLALSTDTAKVILDLESMLTVPELGTKKIAEMMETHKRRLASLENNFEPSISSVKNWAQNNFNIPFWLKILVYVTIGTGCLAVLRYTYFRIKKIFRIAITPRVPDPVLPDYAYNDQAMPNASNVTRPTQSMYFPMVPQKPARTPPLPTEVCSSIYEPVPPSAPTIPRRQT